MADLRAKLGIMEVKSRVEKGLNEREMEARRELRSKDWPEEMMTGSAMRMLEIGQMNSGGGDGGFLRVDGDRRRVNRHLCLEVTIGVGNGRRFLV